MIERVIAPLGPGMPISGGQRGGVMGRGLPAARRARAIFFGQENSAPSPTTLQERLEKAVEAAKKAGAVILKHFRREDLSVQRKDNNEPVTEADQEADEIIRQTLGQAFPQDRLLTEESFQPGQSILLDQTWVVDPLDATRNFSKKIPHFAVSIGYVENNEPKVAVVYDPVRDELFTAVSGQGVQLNGKAISASDETIMQQAVLSFPSPPPQKAQAKNLPNRRLGCAALDMAYVAAGRLDAASEKKLKIWDIICGLLFVREAGGKVTDFQGHPLDLNQPRMNYLATNGKLHQEVQALFDESV